MTFRLNPTYRYFGLAGVVALEQGTTDTPANLEAVQGKLTVVPYYWNPSTLQFEVGRQPSTGGSGAGSTSVDARLSSAGTTAIAGYFSLTPTTPGSSNDYLWVRTVNSAGAGSTVVDVNSISSSTAHIGDVSISNPTTSVTITNPATAVTVSNPTTSVTLTNPATAVNVANQPTVDLSSLGSTRLVGRVEINTPTTLVSVSSGVILAAGSSANVLGAVAQGAGSTSIAPWYVISTASAGAGSTTVDANLTSAGSTKVIGTVNVSSGVILAAGSSGNTIGSVALVAGSSGNTVGAIAQGAGSTSIAPWYVISTASAGAGSTTVDANLSSVGSTRVVGTVNVTSGTILGAGSSANLLGAVSVSSGVVLGAGSTANSLGSVALVAGSSANTVGAVAQGAGSTSIAPWYVISTASAGAGSTTVDAQASSVGSTKLFGQVTVANPTTAVTVSSGVILGAGSSANVLGQIAQGAGSTSIAPWYVISTASAGAGSSAVDATLTSGTSRAFQYVQSIPFSTGNVIRSSVTTTVDTQVVAGNTNRQALVIANGSTTQTVGLGLTTAVVTTARANINLYLPPTTQVRFASNGDFPLYKGPIRGINLTSTAVAGGVIVTEFTST